MTDDDDDDKDKPHPLRIVSDNPNARIERQMAWTREQAQRAISQFAAALLRTMAGSDTESVYLIRHLAQLVEALNNFREESGRELTVAELEEALQTPEAELDSSGDDWRYRRWVRNHGMDLIVKGALRLAAHKVLGEEPAFGGMHSERVIKQGINTLEELKRPAPPPKPRPEQARDLAPSRDGLLGPSKEESKRTVAGRLGSSRSLGPSDRRSTGRRAAFDQEDLKELRKAVKAKDNKRIAELMAKIGRPTFEEPSGK